MVVILYLMSLGSLTQTCIIFCDLQNTSLVVQAIYRKLHFHTKAPNYLWDFTCIKLYYTITSRTSKLL
jgi:hypothetical protein